MRYYILPEDLVEVVKYFALQHGNQALQRLDWGI